jgi:hypothetical protein
MFANLLLFWHRHGPRPYSGPIPDPYQSAATGGGIPDPMRATSDAGRPNPYKATSGGGVPDPFESGA